MKFSIKDLIEFLILEGQYIRVISGDIDSVSYLCGFRSLQQARPHNVLWTRSSCDLPLPNRCVLLAPPGSIGLKSDSEVVVIEVNNPRLAFIKSLSNFSRYTRLSGIDPTAQVSKNAIIGTNVYIGPYAVIGDDVIVGADSIIHGHVYICCPTKIGRNCVIHAGTVIGADGFGYERLESGELLKFPHVGGVCIGDNVEVGSNVCIDRGALDNTIIHSGVKIDNLCHIAHNVEIERNAAVIALAMIAGSVKVKRNAWIAPGAIIREGRVIGAGATVGLGAVVVKDVPDHDIVSGVPAKSRRGL